MSTSNRNAYGVTIITPSVQIEREIHYTALCGHSALSVRFISSAAIVDRLASELARKPCNRCVARMPLGTANRSNWRVVGR